MGYVHMCIGRFLWKPEALNDPRAGVNRLLTGVLRTKPSFLTRLGCGLNCQAVTSPVKST